MHCLASLTSCSVFSLFLSFLLLPTYRIAMLCIAVKAAGCVRVCNDDDDARDAKGRSASPRQTGAGLSSNSSHNNSNTKGAQRCRKADTSLLLSSPFHSSALLLSSPLPTDALPAPAAGCAVPRLCSRCFSPAWRRRWRRPRTCSTTSSATSTTARSSACSPSKTKAPLK